MAIQEYRLVSSIRTPDDSPLFVVRRDLSGGVNTRQEGTIIGENQATLLYNVDIGVSGQRSKRLGSTLIGNDVSNNDIVTLHNYERQGYSDSLLCYEGTNVREWTGSGDWSAAIKSDFTASQTDVGIISAKESGLVPDDITIVQNGTDNAFRLHKDSTGTWASQDLGNTNTSPPITTVMCWFGNRVWALKNDLLYYSDAYDTDYSGAFDRTTNAFRVPVGTERKLLATRDTGMIVMGDQAIWGFAPSATPAVTDQPQPILTDMGVVSKKGAVVAADDVYFFSHDGLRGLKRTQLDKMQSGASYPISYRLKDEFSRISWGNIQNLSMIYWDNKVIVSVPVSSSTYDTWVYYPALDAFFIIQGWVPLCWEKFKVSNQENLYYGKDGDGVVYRGFYGYTDEGTTTTNGTAINYQEEGRKEDLGQPLIKKIGGEVEVKALATGDYTITVSASFDDSDFQAIGTINLSANDVTLPQDLPFTLDDLDVINEKFHLESFGSWRTIKLKFQHNATNSSDDIIIYEHSIISYPEQYLSE